MRAAENAWADDFPAWDRVLEVRRLIVDALKKELDFEPEKAATSLLHWLEKGDGLEEIASACQAIYEQGYENGAEDGEEGSGYD
ncbi:MAG TPA: hypothetical protein VIU62_06895 [Chloroflexota bacterium]